MPSAYCAQLTRDLLAIAKFLFIVLSATYSVNVNFRDYSNYVDRMNPLFPCDHGAANIHALCMIQDVVRYVKLRTGAARGLEIQDSGDMWPDW